MKKKSQIHGQVIKYLFIAFVVILIQILGYNFLNSIKDKQCNAEISKFEIDLNNLGKATESGSVEKRNIETPCSADKILFIDLKKNQSLDNFNEHPLIRNSIKSGAGKNVFVVKDNKVLREFEAGDFEFSYPYYSCMVPRNNEISFFLEKKGTKLKLIPGCEQMECTEISLLNITEKKARELILEIINHAECSFCPENIEAEIIDFKNALENAQVYKRIKYCPDTGITNVRIRIVPNEGTVLENFRFYEYIPKECIDDINKYLTENIKGDVFIEADPLIVWNFDKIEEETEMEYNIKKKLDVDCLRIIESIGVTQLAYNKKEKIEKSPPEIIGLSKFWEFYSNEEKEISLNARSNRYLLEELEWKSQNNEVINVEIKNNKAYLTAPDLWVGEEAMKISVYDPDNLMDSEEIKVIIKSPGEIKFSKVPDATLKGNVKRHERIIDLKEHISFSGDKSDIEFKITNQGNPNLCYCMITDKDYVTCTAERNEDGYSNVDVEAVVNNIKSRASFNVRVEKVDLTLNPNPENPEPNNPNPKNPEPDNPNPNNPKPNNPEPQKGYKFFCSEEKYSPEWEKNIDGGECAKYLGEGWSYTGKYKWKLLNKKKPLCKRTWETQCSASPSCESGTKIRQEECTY